MNSEWSRTTWGDVASLEYGKALRDYQNASGEFPVYGTNGPIGYHDKPLCDTPGVVIGRKGAYRGVHYSSRPFYVIDTAFYLKPKASIDMRWAYYALLTCDINGMDSGSAIPSTSREEFYKLSALVPPLLVQKQIADFLEMLDDRITLLRETNKTLEAIAQALFKSWFVDFDPVRAKMEGGQPEGMDEATAALFPESFEESELGLVPRGWKVLPFLEVCEMQGGAQPPASEFKDESREGYIRLLQIRDFSTDAHKTYVPLEKKLKTATDDDILIGRYGSASGDKEKDSLGRVCRGLAGAYNVALMKLVPLLVGREFAMQLVDDPRFYQYLQGVSSKAVQSGFSKKELAQYKVAVPSANLCEKYETFGALIWRRSKKIKEQIENLSNLRDTLLPRLISGQLRLPEAEAEIETLTA